MTVTLLWKCNELIVTQPELLRYYGNAIWCIDHVTKENLICHNMNINKLIPHLGNFVACPIHQLFLICLVRDSSV
jgi:hypothetical protein